MAHGLRTWDDAGNLMIDITTRLSRILGVVALPRNGSLINAGLLTGTGFAVQLSSAATEEYSIVLNFTFSGSTLSWVDHDNLYNSTDYPATIALLYGVY